MTRDLSLRAHTRRNEPDSLLTENQDFASALLSAELSAQPEIDRFLALAHSAFVHDRDHDDGYADHDDEEHLRDHWFPLTYDSNG